MIKSKKILLGTLMLITSLSSIFGIGISYGYVNKSDNLNLTNSSLSPNSILDNPSNFIYEGETLNIAAVQSLKWDSKTKITLDDWAQYAPNVTTIDGAFNKNVALQSIEIPSKLTKIGNNSFQDSVITEVIFEENSKLDLIGDSSFAESKLAKIELPESVTFISSRAFRGTKITEINIPNNVNRLATATFMNTTELKKITFSSNSNLQEIGPNCFSYSGLTSIIFPDSLNEPSKINSEAFEFTSNMRDISMVGTLKDGSQTAKYKFTQNQWDNISWRIVPFTGTILLKKDVVNLGWDIKKIITLADWNNWAPNVTKIGNYYENGIDIDAPFRVNQILEKIEIPAYIEEINTQSFESTSSLKSISFEENSRLKLFGNNAFNGSGITSIEIPDSVETILDNAFFTTTALESINIPISLKGDDFIAPRYGLTQIQWDSVIWRQTIFLDSILTEKAVKFLGWNTKTEITLDDWKNAPNVTKIGDEIDSPFLSNAIIDSIYIPSRVISIGIAAFENTSSLKTILFESNSNLKEIDQFAFASSAIESIDIPNSVTSIGDNSFESTNSLIKISMPISLRNNGVDDLTTPRYGFTQPQWDSILWTDNSFFLSQNSIIFIGVISGVFVLAMILNITSFVNINKVKKIEKVEKPNYLESD